MNISITTRYETYPGSNVGRYRARAFGRTLSVRSDLTSSVDQNHLSAARALVDTLRGVGVVPLSRAKGQDVVLDRVEDDGSRIWTVQR